PRTGAGTSDPDARGGGARAAVAEPGRLGDRGSPEWYQRPGSPLGRGSSHEDEPGPSLPEYGRARTKPRPGDPRQPGKHAPRDEPAPGADRRSLSQWVTDRRAACFPGPAPAKQAAGRGRSRSP